MTSLSVYGFIALAISGLGYYAKTATERAVLAESAADVLAKGYEQYERRINDGIAAQERRDAEWKKRKKGYEKQITELKKIPVSECDAAPVDYRITKRLLSSAGYTEKWSGDSSDTSSAAGAPSASAYISNRGQSEWIAAYQKQLDNCNTQLVEIKKLVDAPK